MSGYEDEDQTDDASKLVKDLRKQIEEQSKANKELSEQLASFAGKDRTRTLAEALSSKGVNAKIAKFVPSDLDVASDSALEAWLVENAEVFGIRHVDDEAEAETKEAVQLQQRVSSTITTARQPGREEETARRIREAKTSDELMSILQAS